MPQGIKKSQGNLTFDLYSARCFAKKRSIIIFSERQKGLIKEGEALDDLQVGGLHIIQHSQKYRFTCDAVALASFVKIKPNDIIADFCTGSGVIAVLLAGKYGAKKVNAVEIQPYMAQLAQRNVEFNSLDDQISVFEADVNNAAKILGYGTQSVVVCNPPYRKQKSGAQSESEEIAICRHEIMLSLENMVDAAAKVLKYRGRLYFVHLSERLGEIFAQLKKSGFCVKVLQPLCPKQGAPPHLVLIEAVLHGNEGLRLLNPLVVGDLPLK